MSSWDLQSFDHESLQAIKDFNDPTKPKDKWTYLHLKDGKKLELKKMGWGDYIFHQNEFTLKTIRGFISKIPLPPNDEQLGNAIKSLNEKIKRHNFEKPKDHVDLIEAVGTDKSKPASDAKTVAAESSVPGHGKGLKPLSATTANTALIEAVRPHFPNRKIKLPGEAENKMTGEEHIYAMLHGELIDQQKRQDVVILPFGRGNNPPPDFASLADGVRFVISPCAVSGTTHNTVLVIDRHNKEYFYFDSLSHLKTEKQIEHDLSEIVANHRRANFLPPDFTYNRAQGTQQVDGWSCGFHAVENAVCVVSGVKISNNRVDGNKLRGKYEKSFELFVDKHHKLRDDHGVVQRFQKANLLEALKILDVNKENDLLGPLFDFVQSNYKNKDEVEVGGVMTRKQFMDVEDLLEQFKIKFKKEIASNSPKHIISLKIFQSAVDGEISEILKSIPFEYPINAGNGLYNHGDFKPTEDERIFDLKNPTETQRLNEEKVKEAMKEWYEMTKIKLETEAVAAGRKSKGVPIQSIRAQMRLEYEKLEKAAAINSISEIIKRLMNESGQS